MTQTTTTPDPLTQTHRYVGSLELRDGQIHFIESAEMLEYYGAFYAPLNVVVYGGSLSMPDPLTLAYGRRVINIQFGSIAELTSRWGEQSDVFVNTVDTPEVRAELEPLVQQVTLLNADTQSLLGTERANRATTAGTSQDGHGIPIRLRLGPGVSLHHLPRSGMTLQHDGNITDTAGTLLYVKASNASAAPTGRATDAVRPATPRAAAPTTRPTGLFAQLGRLLRGRDE